MDVDELNRYLHAHIPLSVHMGMRVLLAEPGRMQVALPRAPNLNPHRTVFGGALTALGLASGWLLLHAEFVRAGVPVMLVGQRSGCDFLAPATDDCIAESRLDLAEIDMLLATFAERGRVRQTVLTQIRVGAVQAARHSGLYAARRPE